MIPNSTPLPTLSFQLGMMYSREEEFIKSSRAKVMKRRVNGVVPVIEGERFCV